MRVRDHIALSSAGAAVASPWVGRRVLSAGAASVLIDVDHYLWFAVRERHLNPLSAIRFFNQVDASDRRAARLLHHPLTLASMTLLAKRRRWALPIAVGMALHVGLDVYHQGCLRKARASALRRDRFTCQKCRLPRHDVTAHLWRQPMLLPSYRTENLVTLCADCHRAAHEGRPVLRGSGT